MGELAGLQADWQKRLSDMAGRATSQREEVEARVAEVLAGNRAGLGTWCIGWRGTRRGFAGFC